VWAVGAAVGIVLVENQARLGMLGQLGPVATLVVSVVLYAIVVKVWPNMAARKREYDLHTQVPDLMAARIKCHACDRSYVAIEMDVDPSANDAPICNACAETSNAFHRAIRA
jgi:hypothetical protein